MGYQAATDEMELKVRGALQVPLDHVVRREKWNRHWSQELETMRVEERRRQWYWTDQGKMILKLALDTKNVHLQRMVYSCPLVSLQDEKGRLSKQENQ